VKNTFLTRRCHSFFEADVKRKGGYKGKKGKRRGGRFFKEGRGKRGGTGENPTPLPSSLTTGTSWY